MKPGGGLESKTGLKSSSPEREMVAKSSSAAEPSLASSRPSKSSSRSSNAPPAGLDVVAAAVLVGAGCEAVAAAVEGKEEPKMSSTLELLRLLRLAWAAFSLLRCQLRHRQE